MFKLALSNAREYKQDNKILSSMYENALLCLLVQVGAVVICVRIVTEAISNIFKYIQNLVIRIIDFREFVTVILIDFWLVLKYILITRQKVSAYFLKNQSSSFICYFLYDIFLQCIIYQLYYQLQVFSVKLPLNVMFDIFLDN